MMANQYRKDWKVCRKMARKYRGDFGWSLALLLPSAKMAIEILQAFFYLAANFKIPIDVWKRAFEQTQGWEGEVEAGWVPVLRAASKVCREYGIPYKYTEAYIEGIDRDKGKTEYQTYGELEKHMYGSVGVVAIVIAHVIGFTDKRALLFAEELGYAIELTNILRHLLVDVEAGKIYLPKAERESFGITKEKLLAHKLDETFVRFMGFQMSRARALYVSADEGISLLREENRFAVRLLASMSEALLDEIERNNFDVFKKPIKISWLKKMKIYYSLRKTEKGR